MSLTAGSNCSQQLIVIHNSDAVYFYEAKSELFRIIYMNLRFQNYMALST
jgi:hypothetical protein